jgi:hypothetical protein
MSMHAAIHLQIPALLLCQEGCLLWAHGMCPIVQDITCHTGSLLPHLERYHKAGCQVYSNQQYNPAPQYTSAALSIYCAHRTSHSTGRPPESWVHDCEPMERTFGTHSTCSLTNLHSCMTWSLYVGPTHQDAQLMQECGLLHT